MHCCSILIESTHAQSHVREILEIIDRYYRHFQRRDAASTLQAALRRHLEMRCDNPRHTARTNTPGEAPVLCYQYCHNHPRNVKCWATRTEYFNRIIAKHGRKKRGRAWA